MKLKSAVFSVIALVVLSVSTAWADAPKTPTKSDLKTAQDASKRLCEETEVNVGKALNLALDGKTEAQIKQSLHERWKIDERSGTKFHTTVLDEDSWINAITPQIMASAKAKTGNVGRSMYVEAMKTQYLASCRDEFKAILLKEFIQNR